MLADASPRIAAATDIVAARFAVVDAIDEDAARFYTRFGCQQLPGGPRLVRRISDLANDVATR
jgi:hypothetical protein